MSRATIYSEEVEMTIKTESRTMKAILEEIQQEDTIKTKTGIFVHNTKTKQNLQSGMPHSKRMT